LMCTRIKTSFTPLSMMHGFIINKIIFRSNIVVKFEANQCLARVVYMDAVMLLKVLSLIIYLCLTDSIPFKLTINNDERLPQLFPWLYL